MKYEYFGNPYYEDIARKEKVSTLTAKAIEAYGLKLDKDLELKNPYDFKGMQEVVGFLHRAIHEKKKIMVYGDYDVDGICSVGILKRMFSLLDTEIGYYLPNRYVDGYGINLNRAQEIVDKGYEVLICIDNGINAIEPIKLAKENGLNVVVLDHHELVNELPQCDYYLHPNLSEFASYNMCASSVAYYLSLAMLDNNDDKCAILAGIATISDVMPLIEQNKLLVRNAIKLLNKNRFANLNLLVENKEYDENIISMYLVPKLNSLGRVIKDHRVNFAINFLFETDSNKTVQYLNFINECNDTRKKISNQFYDSVDIGNFNAAIVVKNDDLIEGVAGIVASRLSHNYNKVAVVFAKSEDGNFYKGSARSIKDINIVEILSRFDYLVNYGGHSGAAGLTINLSDFERFKEDLTREVSNIKVEEAVTRAILVDEEEITYDNYLELLKYGPFGEGNPYPLFALRDIDKNLVSHSKDNRHLIIKLNNDVTLLAFNLANKFEEKYNKYEAIFILDKNNLFKNKLSCKCEEIIGG